MSGTIWNEDCRTGLSHVEDGSVDLVLMDPPYEFASVRGSGAFGSGNRAYHSELEGISHGIDAELLDLIMSKMRAVNAYVFCSRAQLPFYLGYFSDRGCNFDLLTWHKSNPTPACSNKYLSDTEYIVFARDPGVRLYGSYDTKRKWWVTPVNRRDRELYGHPTVKPLEIVRTLVENSTRGGGRRAGPLHGLRDDGRRVRADRTGLRGVRGGPDVLRHGNGARAFKGVGGREGPSADEARGLTDPETGNREIDGRVSAHLLCQIIGIVLNDRCDSISICSI